MLTNFRIQNFKVFEDTSEIDLAPLTLLAGVNSAGKSSLIQALLLLKQTLESRSSQALNLGKGPLLEQSLGNFSDCVFGRPVPEEATLTYQLAFSYKKEDDTKLFDELNALLAGSGIDTPRESLSSEVVVTFGWGPFGHRSRPTVRVIVLEITVLIDQRPLVGLQVRPIGDGTYKLQPIREKTHSVLAQLDFQQLQIDGLSNFLPDSLIITFSGQRALPESYMPSSLARFFRGLFAGIRRDLSERIYYLNSFREPPLRWYQGGQTAEMALNPYGSNFAEVLWRFRDEPIQFVHPNIPSEQLLLVDMVAWVLSHVLQLKQSIRIQPVGKREEILEVRVDTLGPRPVEVTLAEVGLGYNQILPIVVQGLLAPPGGLVILEQPEIHLHPDVQARLIDFFFGLARAGRRVLVETHSSHMVDNLCLAIAKDRSNWLAENATVLFVHPPDAGNRSARIEPVQIDPYGQILNWPPLFLPDTAAIYEEILKEGLAKRREHGEK